ncbi:MAG: tetratricopeptide repeat protein [Planctomycetota bacterium]|jgi:tetratricopeptide (TPR) repeat protein
MDLSKHLKTADDAIKRRNYAVAIKTYGMVLGLQPDNGEARAGLRQALFKKVEQKPASKVVAIIGGGVHLIAGALMRLFKQYAAAARAYERYLALDPLAEGANLKLGRSLQQAGYRKAALAVFRGYAEARPRCLEACRSAGALLYEAGELQPALDMYELALKVNPRDQESLKARKNLAAEGALKATGLADATASRDLIKDKEQQRKLEKVGRLQLSKAEIDQEVEHLEEQLAERPNDLKLLVRMADLLEMDDDLSAAHGYLEQAVRQDPANSDLQNRVGALQLRLQEKKVQEAEARGDESAASFARKALMAARLVEYRRQVAQNPTDLTLRFQLGKALLAMGEAADGARDDGDGEQLDEAIASLQQGMKDPRHKGESLFLLGQAFRRKGLAELAMGQLQKAREAVGRSDAMAKEVLYAMGCVAEDMGQRDQALGHFSTILEQDIGFRDVARKVDELKKSPSS